MMRLRRSDLRIYSTEEPEVLIATVQLEYAENVRV
jgi:hypothetical protein